MLLYTGRYYLDNIALFCLYSMNCRIKHIKPPCGYNIDGIEAIRLLDFEDFGGFKFESDSLYDSCYITEVLQRGNSAYIDVSAPDSAKYSSTLNNGIYTHSVETFIGDLSASLSSSLHLATKRRYIVLFKTRSGRYFVFGYEAGATITYTNQTTEGLGSLITISANSIYPIFEKAPDIPGQYITVIPTRIILEKPDIIRSFVLTSSSPWHLVSGPTRYITLDTIQGDAGAFTITATGVNIGHGYFTFQNTTGQNTTIYMANVDSRPWILEKNTWNMLGFWYDNGIWNF